MSLPKYSSNNRSFEKHQGKVSPMIHTWTVFVSTGKHNKQIIAEHNGVKGK
jgi:hypothetical protein